jgi:hypothetical protein
MERTAQPACFGSEVKRRHYNAGLPSLYLNPLRAGTNGKDLGIGLVRAILKQVRLDK